MSHELSRRTILRGMGVAVALPWLESLAGAANSSAVPPRRLAYLYVPNGMHMPDWRPLDEGKLGKKLPWILEPLASHAREFSVLSGLSQHHARSNGDGPGDHARAAAAFLTGVQPLKTNGQVLLGISADQVAAKSIGSKTPFRSLQLGCEGGRQSGQCDSGYACAYSHNLSWSGERTPAAHDTNPRLVFDRLFRGGLSASESAARSEERRTRTSVLDFIAADAKGLARKLGKVDKDKLDEYLSGLRELERRIDFAEPENVDAIPDEARPVGVPGDYGEHIRLMCDLLVMAFQTDRTRVITFMLANEGSNRTYREVGVKSGHHTLSHHEKKPEKLESIRKINRFHTTQLAYLLQRLKDVREGGRSLLDSTMLVYGSGIGDGNRHNHHDLPILLAGGGGGALKPGRHVLYPENTPLNNLHLRLLHEMGVATKTLGDSTGLLDRV